MNVRMEIVRDRFPNDRNGVFLWIDADADLYEKWTHCDPEEPVNKPKPTMRLAPHKVDQIVAGWLRGPEGATGPMGATGASGA